MIISYHTVTALVTPFNYGSQWVLQQDKRGMTENKNSIPKKGDTLKTSKKNTILSKTHGQEQLGYEGEDASS